MTGIDPEAYPMANIIHYLTHIRLDFRRSSYQMKLIVIGIIVFGFIGLFVLRSAIRNTENANANLVSQAAQLEQDIDVLDQQIAVVGSVEGVEQIAQDELGLVNPDTVLIQPGE